MDQICIKNPFAKARQICLMGQIYGQARQVVAWLGDATNESSTARLSGTELPELHDHGSAAMIVNQNTASKEK